MIYPVIGPRRVTCQFPDSLRKHVIGALDGYVTLFGRLKTKTWNRFPHAVEVEALELHPSVDDLPKLRDLSGMAPDLTHGLSTEDFLARVRDA